MNFLETQLNSARKLSLRIRNFETGSTRTPEKKDAATGKVVEQQGRTHGRPSKVNDRHGHPVEISAVVVWRVVNTAEASFHDVSIGTLVPAELPGDARSKEIDTHRADVVAGVCVFVAHVSKSNNQVFHSGGFSLPIQK